MPFGRILVPVYDARLLELKLAHALQVAVRFRSKIQVIFVHEAIDPTTVESDPILNDKALEMAEENWDRERPSADAVAALVSKWAADKGVRSRGTEADDARSCYVGVLTNQGASSLEGQARASDLIVIGQPDRGTTHQEQQLNKTLLMMSGRPILIVPVKAQTSQSMFDHAILAWDGGLQISRTVGLTMPLLESSAQVTVFRSMEPGQSASVEEEVLECLRCNGISARSKIETHGSSRIASSLLAHAQETTATLICMGAYSNPRTMEILIGGNTQHIYHHSAFPVLIST